MEVHQQLRRTPRWGFIYWSLCVGVAFLCLCGSPLTASAQTSPAVTIFDLGGGVRALGMGDAFVGLADDEQAVFYNPAGLAYLARLGVNALYESHFLSSSYLGASFGMRQLGFGFSTFSLGDVEQRNDNDTVTGAFGYASFAVVAGGGISFSDLPVGGLRGWNALAMGLRAKYVGVSTLSPGSGGGFGIDPAFMFNAPKANLGGLRTETIRAGLLFENLLSTGTGYSGRSETWPLRVRAGTSIVLPPPVGVTVGLDIAAPFEFHLGGEVRLRPFSQVGDLAIRLGGMVRHGTFVLTLGLGVEVEGFRFDYAFISNFELAGSHRLALSWHL